MADETKYQWDETKRQETLQARGIDFADMAQFDWDAAITREDIRSDYGERRYTSIGPIEDRLFVCIWCQRGSNIRIISLRKANSREEKFYEQAQIIH